MKYTPFPGQELRERREAMGLTIEEAFRKTRVPLPYIRAIESGEIHALPASCYTVGFLKSYCVFLEVDSNRFLDSYQTLSRPSVARFLRRSTNEEKPHVPGWVQDCAAWAVVTGLVVFGWFAYSLIFQPSPGAEPKRADAAVKMVVPAPQGMPLPRQDPALGAAHNLSRIVLYRMRSVKRSGRSCVDPFCSRCLLCVFRHVGARKRYADASVKIPALGFVRCFLQVRGPELFHDKMRYAGLNLQLPGYAEKRTRSSRESHTP